MSQTRAQLVKGFTNTSAADDTILVDSNGNVGINATPEAWSGFDALEVNEASIVSSGSGDAFFTANAYYDGAWKYKDAGVARNIYMNSDGIVFRTAASGSADAAITWTECGRWREAGGLTFNGDTATANALDDYEEGTFTPTAQGSTTAGTASYSQQVGKYTKIGDRVFFEIYIHWDSGTGSGSALYIYGLPFAAQSSSQTYPAASIGYFHNISFTANSSPGALVASGSTYVYFYAIPNGGGSNAAIAYDSAGSMIISGHYKVN